MEITILFKEVEFEVEYDYQPMEPMVMYYKDGSGYPGCPETIEIGEIKHKGTCFFELLEEHFVEIEELILDKMHE